MTASEALPSVTYTQALAKGGALLPETRALLGLWRPGISNEAFAKRVLEEDALGKTTARRVLDVVRVFTLRFLSPTDAPARHLQRLLSRNSARQTFNDLVFYYAARNDSLLHDFTVLRYWPLVREGRLTISNRDVHQLILEAEHDGRIRAPWSAEIKRDMAGRVLITLTDFGLLQEWKRAVREVVPYHPADGTVLYIAYLLHSDGVTDASIADQPAWDLFGLEPQDVWNRFTGLSGEGWFVVQRAGQVARITWRYASVEGLVDAIA